MERITNMEQSQLNALKEKRSQTFTKVKAQAKELRYYKEHVTHLEAQLRKSQKRYELLDRKIFKIEHAERIEAERIKASQKTKPTKIKSKINDILSSMSEDQLKALLEKI